MQTVGDCSIFAFGLAPASSDPAERLLRSVSIFVDGVNFTEEDSIVYVPQFIHSLRQAVIRLNNIDLDFYRDILNEAGPEDIHCQLSGENLIENSRKDDMVTNLQFMEFGEITYNLLSFFVPRRWGDWLTCQSLGDVGGERRIHSVCISRDVLVKNISDAACIMEQDFEKGGCN